MYAWPWGAHPMIMVMTTSTTRCPRCDGQQRSSWYERKVTCLHPSYHNYVYQNNLIIAIDDLPIVIIEAFT